MKPVLTFLSVAMMCSTIYAQSLPAEINCAMLPYPGHSVAEIDNNKYVTHVGSKTTFKFQTVDSSTINLTIRQSKDPVVNGTHVMKLVKLTDTAVYMGNYRAQLSDGRYLFMRYNESFFNSSKVEGDYMIKIVVGRYADKLDGSGPDSSQAIRVCARGNAPVPKTFVESTSLSLGGDTVGFASSLNAILKNSSIQIGNLKIVCEFSPAHHSYGVDWKDMDNCEFEQAKAVYTTLGLRVYKASTVLNGAEAQQFIQKFGLMNTTLSPKDFFAEGRRTEKVTIVSTPNQVIIETLYNELL